MKGDLSRDTFDRERHYSAVRLQQGRVVTDADWNEQADLTRYRAERQARDVIGACGAPLAAAGYGLVAETNAIAVHAVNANVAWIAAEDGALLTTVDGGADWVLVDLQTGEHLRALQQVGGVGWAVGDGGVVRKTGNQGITWLSQDAGTLNALRGVSVFDADHAWAVGDGGVAVGTADGGATWHFAETGAARLHAVHFIDPLTGVAVGQGGAIVSTGDGGESWTSVASGTSAHLRALAGFGTTLLWAAGQDGTIVRSEDFGATWLPCNTPSTATLYGIALVDDLEGWAVGAGGALLHSTDGGANWTEEDSGTDATLRGVSVFGTEAPWVVGDGTTALRPANGSPDVGPVALPSVGLSIEPGRCYVDGTLCELEARTSYAQQADGGAGARLAPGAWLIYLDAWQRHLSALEAPAIREVALGGPDTATRAQSVAQVRALPLDATSPFDWNCDSSIPAWDALVDAPRPRLAARSEPQLAAANLCEIAATAGYRRLENQLYRVEIHAGGAAPTFKWSRENGSVAYAVVAVTVDAAQQQTIVRVAARGRDTNLDLAVHDRVELVDDDAELTHRAGVLFEYLNDGDDELELVLGGVPAAPWATIGQDPSRHPVLRRWDHQPAIVGSHVLPVIEGTWNELEDGVQVRFESGGSYRPGDYWQIPARTITADVEWPHDDDGDPVAREPAGIADAYCRLGIVEVDADGFVTVASDCRNLFPPLTMLEQLLYVSGDGQDAPPGGLLPQPVAVRVARGTVPLAGVGIRFEVESGGGRVGGSSGWFETTTDADGLAQADWTLGPSAAAPACFQRLRASLLDSDGLALPGQVVVFCATASLVLQYVSGDGQDAGPGATLPHPLELRVANGGEGVGGVVLQVTVEEGGGSVAGGTTVTTDPDGLATLAWQLGIGGGQRLRVDLLDGDGATALQRLAFNATLSGAAAAGTGCDVTIGKAGQFAELNSDVLNKLLKQGGGNLCICFLPGTHDITDLEANGGQVARLSLHGCGHASTIQLRKPATLVGFAALELRDLVIQAEGEIGLSLQKNGDVRLASMDFARAVSDATTPCVSILGADRVGMTGCAVTAAPSTPAIVLDGIAGDCRMAHNSVVGIVSFYGAPAAAGIAELRAKLATGGGRLPAASEGKPSQLAFHGNHLSRLLVSQAAVDQLFSEADNVAYFDTAAFTDNTIDGPQNLFISRLLTMGSTSFVAPVASGQGIYALMLAGSATVFGNIGSVTKVPLFVGTHGGAAVEAANAIDVETFPF